MNNAESDDLRRREVVALETIAKFLQVYAHITSSK